MENILWPFLKHRFLSFFADAQRNDGRGRWRQAAPLFQDGLQHGDPAAAQHQVLCRGALLQHGAAAGRDTKVAGQGKGEHEEQTSSKRIPRKLFNLSSSCVIKNSLSLSLSICIFFSLSLSLSPLSLSLSLFMISISVSLWLLSC
jgi:hypothetical protein